MSSGSALPVVLWGGFVACEDAPEHRERVAAHNTATPNPAGLELMKTRLGFATLH
jgi:hypothetical protein